MHYPMRLDVATLGKSSAADITRIRTLPGVTALMSLPWISSRSKILTFALRKTFRFPSCEKRCPQVVSLQVYFRLLVSMSDFQVGLDDPTYGLCPVCARI